MPRPCSAVPIANVGRTFTRTTPTSTNIAQVASVTRTPRRASSPARSDVPTEIPQPNAVTTQVADATAVPVSRAMSGRTSAGAPMPNDSGAASSASHGAATRPGAAVS